MNNIKSVLFDLDNTLYPKEAGIFSCMDKRINTYMHQYIGISSKDADRLRKDYWQKYGLTLIGLMMHHNVNPEHYLLYVHNIELKKYLKPDLIFSKGIDELDYQKILFTNSCGFYAQKVLDALHLRHFFSLIFDIRKADFMPKPDIYPYKKILAILNMLPENCVMVDDSLPNLKTANDIGMKTILVGSDENASYINASAINQRQIIEILKYGIY